MSEHKKRCTCGETACESELCGCDAVPCPVGHAAEQPAAQVEAAITRTESLEQRPCGGQPGCLPHGAHRYMLGVRIYQCPGGPPWWATALPPRHVGHVGATRTTSPTDEGQPVQDRARAADGRTAARADELRMLAAMSDGPFALALAAKAAAAANERDALRLLTAERAVTAAYTLANAWETSGQPLAADDLRTALDKARTQEQPARPATMPGSTAEQLPAEVLAPLDLIPYLSTACQTAGAIWDAAERIPDAGKRAGALHTRCRLNHKFTGQQCTCDCHTTEETP